MLPPGWNVEVYPKVNGKAIFCALAEVMTVTGCIDEHAAVGT